MKMVISCNPRKFQSFSEMTISLGHFDERPKYSSITGNARKIGVLITQVDQNVIRREGGKEFLKGGDFSCYSVQ